jgi:hypothetical protein
MVCGDKHKNNFGYWVAQYGLNPTRRHNHGVCVITLCAVMLLLVMSSFYWGCADVYRSISAQFKLPAAIGDVKSF